MVQRAVVQGCSPTTFIPFMRGKITMKAALMVLLLASAAEASMAEEVGSTVGEITELIGETMVEEAPRVMALKKGLEGNMTRTNYTAERVTPPPLPELNLSRTRDENRVQWMLAEQDLDSMGYEGSVSELARTFNTLTQTLDEEMKAKIVNGSDRRLTWKVVNAVANRKMAMERETELTSNRVQVAEVRAVQEPIPAEVNPAFREKIAYIMSEGSEAEKTRLMERLQEYNSGEHKVVALKVAEKIRTRALNHTLIRGLLKTNTGVRTILEAQAA